MIDFGNGVHYFGSGNNVFGSEHHWAIVLTNVFYGIAMVSLYIFMFGRLYLTFKASTKEYHLRHVIFMQTLRNNCQWFFVIFEQHNYTAIWLCL